MSLHHSILADLEMHALTESVKFHHGRMAESVARDCDVIMTATLFAKHLRRRVLSGFTPEELRAALEQPVLPILPEGA